MFEKANTVEDIVDKTEYKQPVWYGRINTMDNDSWTKKMLQYTSMNRRKRGRLQKPQRDGIQEAI